MTRSQKDLVRTECRSTPIEDCGKFKILLPCGFSYHICYYEETDLGFCASIRTSMTSKEDIFKWKNQFQESSLTTWRVARTHPQPDKRVEFRVDYRCQHKTRHLDEKYVSKNTNCKASMTIRLLKAKEDETAYPAQKRGRLNGEACESDLPTWITLVFEHNHSISTPSALRFRDVPKSIEDKFVTYFRQGHSVNSALRSHVEDVRASTREEDLKYALVDRARVPDKSWCYKVYTKVRKHHPEVRGLHKLAKKRMQEASETTTTEQTEAVAAADAADVPAVAAAVVVATAAAAVAVDPTNLNYSPLQREVLEVHTQDDGKKFAGVENDTLLVNMHRHRTRQPRLPRGGIGKPADGETVNAVVTITYEDDHPEDAETVHYLDLEDSNTKATVNITVDDVTVADDVNNHENSDVISLESDGLVIDDSCFDDYVPPKESKAAS